jgi:dTDP-4-amino-4,6-dideoxygalactose transaminase
LDDSDIEAVTQVIKSNNIAQGKKVAEFEKRLAEFIGVKYALVTHSGTAALHLILLTLGVGHGDEVIVPSFICSALLNAIAYVGAIPCLAEINFKDYNLSFVDVKKKINHRTKAIIITHSFGLPANIFPFLDLGVPLIEDCAHTLGATLNNTKVGTFSKMALCSFYATKLMTTGEGGVVLTNSECHWRKIKDLRDYDQKRDYKIRYNYKMTDLQAALGIRQLEKLPRFIRRRKEIARRYSKEFRRMRFHVPVSTGSREHVFFRYLLRAERPVDEYIYLLYQKGIVSRRPVYRPLHHYLGLEGFPKTDRIWDCSMSLPVYPSLTDEETECVIDAVKSIVQKN